MIQDLVIRKINRFSDERGWLGEFFREDEMDFRPVMSYLSVTHPGFVRGPHEHVVQSDFFVFAGPGDFELHLWDNREESTTKGTYQKITAGSENSVAVIVPPGVVHGYKNISTVDAYCINLPDKLYKGKGKKAAVDEIRHEKNANSPFKII
ncbi:dTDP-4-dehydrorhamnose 3,5-epimerase family protein [Patescibacteria group bacterium]|nr:dTDP-4-dehydrorhamnose 3,5-epimerase family protein [Patescibacteria group bacterium]